MPPGSVIFFPLTDTVFTCGLAGILQITRKKADKKFKMPDFGAIMGSITAANDEICPEICSGKKRHPNVPASGGSDAVDTLLDAVRSLKRHADFYAVYTTPSFQHQLEDLLENLKNTIAAESQMLAQAMGHLPAEKVEIISTRIESLKDAAWVLQAEILTAIKKINALLPEASAVCSAQTLAIIKDINTTLNNIDRLEVRGRDSAGISLLFHLDAPAWQLFETALDKENLAAAFTARVNTEVLLNNSISVHRAGDLASQNPAGAAPAAIAFTYKVAAEIGRLGDNIAFIRDQIKNDPVLHLVLGLPLRHHSVSAHTRWASVGAISEANCHPVDSRGQLPDASAGIVHVCLNGDIDNFLRLKTRYAADGILLPEAITCDTKIIPVHIQEFLKKGMSLTQAFRRAVNDFEGSHAICMHSDLAPGKLFLALKGSGQAIFVGLGEDHYVTASEIYGLVETTNAFIKLDGETLHPNAAGSGVNGQIFILDQACGGLDGISAMSYDGTPILLSPADIRKTPLTSRDIDRQEFDHYFLKEISEAPASVRKTIENRWKIDVANGSDPEKLSISLGRETVPPEVEADFRQSAIRRIILIGQGTAGVAAMACADIMRVYLAGLDLRIDALKSSELSGFVLDDTNHSQFTDTLLIPISQSGTTADTNRCVDMVKKQGARVIAIVNRRDSDLSFKSDGVLYTSSGRDIEMSVASTKAFYSQIIAGSLLGLYLAQISGLRNSAYISHEIKEMIALPGHMENVLAAKAKIEASARNNATRRTYWAAVGSGPNKAAADEIRIKLSELCYKTISSDYVEDKKHIDLSSEPLIVICAAGTRQSALGDIIKDTAIFHSHKALPIVICDAHEDRFDPYAKDIIHVPLVSEHFAPVLNTLAGHLWGYYAALAINDGSRFLYDFRRDLRGAMDRFAAEGLDIYEIALEQSFRERIIRFYYEFRSRQDQHQISAVIGITTATHLLLLLKYLGGKLPLADFELDFGIKGTAANMFNQLFETLNDAINRLARPVDAIKHQAKTVTVGTSRIEEKAEGLLFDLLAEKGFALAQLTISNILVLKNLQKIIARINGTTLYRIAGISLLGDPTDDTTIELMEKTGSSAAMPSRAEQDNRLKGTKKIIVRRGNVYIGKGRKDDRSILVVPLMSGDPARPHIIEFLLLLDIAFNPAVSLADKVRALGGKHEHIKNLVQENNMVWQDKFLDRVEMADLFGWSAEKVAETIIGALN